MNRAKTLKKTNRGSEVDNTKGETSLDFLSNMEKGFDDFFNTENKNTLRKPWAKLDKVLRTDRIKEYVASRDKLNQIEKQRLQSVLMPLVLIKTKTNVVYNPQAGKIDDIKGLIETETDTGKQFRIEQQRATKRKPQLKQSETIPTMK